jgi:hypothetical protein
MIRKNREPVLSKDRALSSKVHAHLIGTYNIWQSARLVATAIVRRTASRPEERLKLGEQRVVAGEHIVKRRHRYRIGTMVAKKTTKRVKLRRGAV